MKRYKVYIYFGLHTVNPFLKPTHVVEVETSRDLVDSDIIYEALSKLGAYPKTYSARVEELSNEL